MKHNNLRAIAHNFTDSFASGIGLLIGVYVVDVFGEISNTPEGYIKIDSLNGNTTGGKPSETSVGAITLYCDALPDFCIKHGENVSSFNRFVVSFTNKTHVPQTLIEIEDIKGRYSQDTYIGYPLMRRKVIDKLGVFVRVEVRHPLINRVVKQNAIFDSPDDWRVVQNSRLFF